MLNYYTTTGYPLRSERFAAWTASRTSEAVTLPPVPYGYRATFPHLATTCLPDPVLHTYYHPATLPTGRFPSSTDGNSKQCPLRQLRTVTTAWITHILITIRAHCSSPHTVAPATQLLPAFSATGRLHTRTTDSTYRGLDYLPVLPSDSGQPPPAT